jgi:membrane-bound serine protease (ClpP class)
MRRMGILGLLLMVFFLVPSSPTTAESSNVVWTTRVSGIIDPALSGFLTKTIRQAEEAGAAALVIEMDTPGGYDTSMREIIQAELASSIPIVFYVHPEGSRAASAGLYIMMGADVAVMAPQTNLGAATPVSLTGSMDETMKAKVTNDAAAYMRGLAVGHNRNADWAEQAVREAVSLNATDALDRGVIEFIASDLSSLLEKVDGFETTPKGLTLSTAGAEIKEVQVGWVASFLHAIANPNVAYILVILGILGIIMEFAVPGFGASGVAGIVALLLGFYSFQVLPVSLLGIALIVLAMIFFIAEVKVQSYGVLAAGGTVALVVGGMVLYNTSAPYLKVGWPVLAVVAIAILLFVTVAVRAVAKAMRRPNAVGIESMVGLVGIAISELDPEGQVRIAGEIWRARVQTQDETLHTDEAIEVIESEGLTLVVRRHKEVT